MNNGIATGRARRRRRVVGLAAAVTVATIAAGACSGGGGAPETLAGVARATAAAPGLSVSGRAGSAPVQGASTGGNADATLTFTVRLAGADREVEVRRVGATTYFRRAVVSAAQLRAAGTGAVFARTAAERPWQALPSGDLVTQVTGPLDAAAALARLSAAQLVRIGTAQVGGATVRRYRVRGAPAIVGASPFALRAGTPLELWVGADHVLRRWVSATATLELQSAAGPAISAPGAADLEPRGAGSAARPAGPFAVAASGTTGGVRWTLSRAPGTAGTQCWRVATVPAVRDVAPGAVGGAQCLSRNPATDSGPDAWFYVIAEAGAGATEMVVALAPPRSVRVASVLFAGGAAATRPAVVVPGLGAVLYIGEASLGRVGIVRVTDPSGGQHLCPAGEIQSRDDLAGRTAAGIVAERLTLPWSCFPDDRG